MAILKDLIVQGSSRYIGPAYAGTIYAESFVKDGSDSSYVLLGDGGHMNLSSLNSSHTHYIGTTQVQNSSAAQGLTGITSIVSPASTPLYISPASTLYLDSAAGNSILFRKGTTEIARFNTSSNLCIGTTNPNGNTAYKLDVGGSIKSSDTVQAVKFRTTSYEIALATGGRLAFGTHNQTAAAPVNVGNLLVSNAWAEHTNVPTNGIYSKGQIKSGVASGTAPFVVSSTTKVDNLNADLLDGEHSYALRSRPDNGGDVLFSMIPYINARVNPFDKAVDIDIAPGDAPFGYCFGPTTNYVTYVSGYIPVMQGDVISGEVYVYRDTGASSTNSPLYCGIRRFDKNKKPISYNNGIHWFIASNINVPSDGIWHKYTNTISLPLSHTPYPSSNPVSDGGPVYYIQIVLYVNHNNNDSPPTYIGGCQFTRIGKHYDNIYLKTSGGTMTGAINRIYDSASNDPVLNVASNNQDIWLWRVKDAGTGTPTDVDKVWGFGAKYLGTGTGNNNSWAMYADNQNGAYIKALEMKQSGDLFAYAPIHWTSDSLPSSTSLDYILGIDAFASGGTTKYIKLSDLKTSLGIPTANDGTLKVQVNDTTATNLFTANQSGNSTLKFSNGTNISITNSSNTISIGHATPSSGTAVNGTSTIITANSTKIIQNISVAKDSQGHITSLSYTYATMPSIPAAPGTLNTNNTNAQTVSSNEALSGTINLHKVSKTGAFSDLIGAPTMSDYVTKTELSNLSYLQVYGGLQISGTTDTVGYVISITDTNITYIDMDVFIPPMTSSSYGVAKAKPSGSDLSSDAGYNRIWIDNNGILYNSVSSVNETSLSLGSATGGTGKAITALSVSGTANHTITATYSTFLTSETSLSLGTKSGSGNAITALSVSGHKITATYGSTFLTSHASHSINFTGSQVSGTQSSGTINVLVGINNTYASSGTIRCTYKYKTISLDGTGGGSAENCVTYTSENNGVRTISVVNTLPSSPNKNTLYIIL